jgi:uncharacterized oxidoreductase
MVVHEGADQGKFYPKGFVLRTAGFRYGLARATGCRYKRFPQVVIRWRRQRPLGQVTAANPGMKAMPLDIEDAASLAHSAQKLAKGLPSSRCAHQ